MARPLAILALASAPALAATGWIKGVVAGPSGPLAGLAVKAAPAAGKPARATTGKNGAYALKLAPGSFTLTLEDPKGLWGAAPVQVEVAAGATVQAPIAAELGARVEIALKDRRNRAPRPPVNSRLFCEEGGPPAGSRAEKTVAVRGKVRHDAAPAGRRCKVRLDVTGLPLDRILGPFDLVPGQVVKMEHKIPWL